MVGIEEHVISNNKISSDHDKEKNVFVNHHCWRETNVSLCNQNLGVIRLANYLFTSIPKGYGLLRVVQ